MCIVFSIVACKECFQLFDKDGSGKISVSELGTMVRALGQMPSEAQVQSLIKNVVRKYQVLKMDNFFLYWTPRVCYCNVENYLKIMVQNLLESKQLYKRKLCNINLNLIYLSFYFASILMFEKEEFWKKKTHWKI